MTVDIQPGFHVNNIGNIIYFTFISRPDYQYQ